MFNKEIRLLIVDDHFVVRHGTSLILNQAYKRATIDHVDNICDAISIIKETTYEIFLLDISFPKGNVQQLLDQIKIFQPSAKILIFSALDEEVYAMPYLELGVDGYLHKLSSEEEIIHAVNSILRGNKYLSEVVKEKIISKALGQETHNPLNQLSGRELEVARYLVQGMGNQEICNNLNLQKSTVSTYKNRIFEKLKVKNVVELISVLNVNSRPQGFSD
ncbi:DNA-binding response regulator, NarL/FixJ family, contains REC and HTH domains [Flagellimonas taeanensis]|uniref:DNA-binding response regulator, NarL/FixJ family, contains REC and HTH domains n=1 Tax=Flagellimonas taeanensis TaxID=1005926 RepID=A0A1M6UTG9_9FLAO|nr:response regulator transcription factor [Allomuricauda taeanensis]MEE1964362.1 response regulator transcription factor [Allomuricauda taeanensis]SFC53311.1 DNA-binding response regulator, NarL/FixJ family, contains REC and HTH domains [Allomuricauda taeanensis]SHK72508.1 two component transcriptional regulator, LuxR family [Allomuricauda taeanensis]